MKIDDRILPLHDAASSAAFPARLLGFADEGQRGPGDEVGARGDCKSISFFDPSRHLNEIAYHE